MSHDWIQIGQDFQQKYQGTFCRYTSPISQRREVFFIPQVIPQAKEGPHIVLFNQRAGELFLNYNTEAELNFDYPECNNFLHDKKCFRFLRAYVRQWKKGICTQTAHIAFSYNEIYPKLATQLTSEILESAFKSKKIVSIKEAIHLIENEKYFSLPLTEDLSMGLADTKDSLWLWFGASLIGVLKKKPSAPLREIHLFVPQFKQEIMDFLTRTNDASRPIF